MRKERLAALGQLTATVSHELRNPMSALTNAVAAIKKLTGDKDERLAASLRIVDRSIGRCRRPGEARHREAIGFPSAMTDGSSCRPQIRSPGRALGRYSLPVMGAWAQTNFRPLRSGE